MAAAAAAAKSVGQRRNPSVVAIDFGGYSGRQQHGMAIIIIIAKPRLVGCHDGLLFSGERTDERTNELVVDKSMKRPKKKRTNQDEIVTKGLSGEIYKYMCVCGTVWSTPQ